jgi:hypothetical protein
MSECPILKQNNLKVSFIVIPMSTVITNAGKEQ